LYNKLDLNEEDNMDVIVKVDNSKCIGCGACVSIAPNNFDFDDDGLSKVINEVATDEARSACEACPVEAITLSEVVDVDYKEVDNEKEA